jgi:hypothetical protein
VITAWVLTLGILAASAGIIRVMRIEESPVLRSVSYLALALGMIAES